LWWTDIEGRTISSADERGGDLRQWTLPDRVGSFALCEREGVLLLGLSGGVALFDTSTGAMSAIVPLEMPGPETRINDGRCDAQGRFVFGLFNGANDNAAICPFFRVDAQLRIERLPLPSVCVANSLAFSPDGTRLYFTDSWAREIWCCDYFEDGRIGAPRTFVRIPASQGYPDGSTVDRDGGLWSAQWQGGCVVRYDEAGHETVRVVMPASRVTSAAFGGASLDLLFATTARIGLDDADLLAQPTAGAVFVASGVGWRGLPERRFVCDVRADNATHG
ncbi:MAG: SMP-30/gluconolactonase/LRE family protein, partial [Rhizobacter sp.]|nr:SMP-30/gluconolactonase/LRE family protein [Rhizobacter sp.]